MSRCARNSTTLKRLRLVRFYFNCGSLHTRVLRIKYLLALARLQPLCASPFNTARHRRGATKIWMCLRERDYRFGNHYYHGYHIEIPITKVTSSRCTNCNMRSKYVLRYSAKIQNNRLVRVLLDYSWLHLSHHPMRIGDLWCLKQDIEKHSSGGTFQWLEVSGSGKIPCRVSGLSRRALAYSRWSYVSLTRAINVFQIIKGQPR